MDMSGKTAIVAGLGVSGQSDDGGVGSRAEKVLGVDEKKLMPICTLSTTLIGIMSTW